MANETDIEIDMDSGETVETKQPVEDQVDEPSTSTETEEDERQTSTSEDDELNEAADDEEREAIRERRRNERKHRKQAQKDREDTLRRELASRDAVINEMRGKLDIIERRNSGSEIAQLENAKKQTAQAYAFFKEQISIATANGNGPAVADATEKLLQSQRKFDELTQYEKALKQRVSAPQPLDARLINHAQKWMSDNKWYDPSGKDADSHIAVTVDQRLAQEGWDPTTAEYWQELDVRIKKYLPHRINKGIMNPVKPRSTVAGSGREASTPANKMGSYKLSAERVQALKDAGIWDNPTQRAEAVKRFRDYDKQHQG